MPREIKLGTVAGLVVSVMPSVIVGSISLWIILSVIGITAIKLSTGEAVIGGSIATGLHYADGTLHQWGHALAARRTGYSMIGIRYWGVLSASVYPMAEPALPASTHIRRALGGPIASITIGLVVTLVVLILPSSLGLVYWLASFIAFENLIVFGLGAFLPLGFTDGSTLLKYWDQGST